MISKSKKDRVKNIQTSGGFGFIPVIPEKVEPEETLNIDENGIRATEKKPKKTVKSSTAKPVSSVGGSSVGGTVKYGRDWGGMSNLEIELYCFREAVSIDSGGVGKAENFWNIVAILWPNDGTCRKPYCRQPWAERMVTAATNNQMLSVSGCSGSGKTDWAAVWAIINWLCDPLGTKVMVTSTSLKASRRRIWGSIEDYWSALPDHIRSIGRLASSFGVIRVSDQTGFRASERCGLELIPGERSKEKEATGKIIGIHNRRILLICDELPELSPALMQAAISNLTNNPWCQAVGLGNPASYFDAHGIFSTPKDGWKSINENSDEWETVYGYAIRFDAVKSPNILAGKEIYPYLPTLARLEDAKKRMGESSFGFYRQWRGYFPPEGGEQTVFSDTDIVFFGANSTRVTWATPPTAVCGFDPGFTNDGDRSICYFGLLGHNTDNVMVLLLTEYIVLKDDASDRTTPRNFQIVRAFKAACELRGVLPANAGVDISGAPAFGDIISSEWSKTVHKVQFGGSSSGWRVGADKVSTKERYANRVTELYFEARNYMSRGQIIGVCPDLARELTARRFSTGNGAGSGVSNYRQSTVCIEPKRRLKARVGSSPDVADGMAVLFDVCRMKLRFKLDKQAGNKNSSSDSARWVPDNRGNPDFRTASSPEDNRREILQLLTEEERAAEKKIRYRTRPLMQEMSTRSVTRGGFSTGIRVLR